MTESGKGADLEEILRDPTRVFRQPEDVLLHPELDREAKIAILRWWERHDRDLLARESQKPDGESLRLTRIIRALNALLHDRNLEGEAGKGDGQAPRVPPLEKDQARGLDGQDRTAGEDAAERQPSRDDELPGR